MKTFWVKKLRFFFRFSILAETRAVIADANSKGSGEPAQSRQTLSSWPLGNFSQRTRRVASLR